MPEITGLLPTHEVPSETAARRIAIWRPLKGRGAVYPQTSVCILPTTDDHVRRLNMLENDIDEAKGESVILETVAPERGQQDKVGARLKADREEAYLEFIDRCEDLKGDVATATAASYFTYAELEENDVELRALRGRLAKIEKLDFYGGERPGEARNRLKSRKALLDDHARRVFDANGEIG